MNIQANISRFDLPCNEDIVTVNSLLLKPITGATSQMQRAAAKEPEKSSRPGRIIAPMPATTVRQQSAPAAGGIPGEVPIMKILISQSSEPAKQVQSSSMRTPAVDMGKTTATVPATALSQQPLPPVAISMPAPTPGAVPILKILLPKVSKPAAQVQPSTFLAGATAKGAAGTVNKPKLKLMVSQSRQPATQVQPSNLPVIFTLLPSNPAKVPSPAIQRAAPSTSQGNLKNVVISQSTPSTVVQGDAANISNSPLLTSNIAALPENSNQILPGISALSPSAPQETLTSFWDTAASASTPETPEAGASTSVPASFGVDSGLDDVSAWQSGMLEDFDDSQSPQAKRMKELGFQLSSEDEVESSGAIEIQQDFIDVDEENIEDFLNLDAADQAKQSEGEEEYFPLF